MARLSASERAYIRPSPASGTLGGVAAKTREAMLLCEAAGFDVVLVETVGIGQSETAVCDMTDFFLALMLPGAGDELQGIKKGLVELADMIAVNKADGDNIKRANLAAAEYRGALHILNPRSEHWHPPVLTYSALTGTGIPELWAENSGSPHRDECLGRIRVAAAAAAGEVDVVDAGAADDGAAARRSGDPCESEKDRSRSSRRPHHTGAGGRADRGAAEVSDDHDRCTACSRRRPRKRTIQYSRAVNWKHTHVGAYWMPAFAGMTAESSKKLSGKLRILITGFGPFPGAPFNPTQPLVARLLRLRRPALSDVELTGHIFPVTYKAVDHELPQTACEAQAAGASDVRPRHPHAVCAD